MLEPYAVLQERYRIIYVVDDGADGTIYRAHDLQSLESVLVAGLRQADAAAMARTRERIGQIARLNITGLLRVRALFAVQANKQLTLYLVVEDPAGEDLTRASSADTRVHISSPHTVEPLALQNVDRLLSIVEVLQAQDEPMFLGGLRTSDLWVSLDGTLHLAPFALLRSDNSMSSPYRAPELIDEQQSVSVTSDLYVVGAVFYQLLTGWPPPLAEQRLVGTPVNPPRALHARLSSLAERMALRALELDPANRYQLVREMRQAVKVVRIMSPRTVDSAPSVVVPASPAVATPETSTVHETQKEDDEDVYDDITESYSAVPLRSTSDGSNTCMVLAFTVLTLVWLMICGVGGMLFFEPSRTFLLNNLHHYLVPADPENHFNPTSVPTEPPKASEPMLLSTTNISEVVEVQELIEGQLSGAEYAPDGRLLAIGVGNSVLITDTTGNTPGRLLEGHQGSISALAWGDMNALSDAPDGETVLLLASGAVSDTTVRVWDVDTGGVFALLEGHSGWIRSLAFSADGRVLASGSTDWTIKVWDVANGNLLYTLEGHTDWLGNIAFDASGERLVSASRDGSVRLWDIKIGSELGAGNSQTTPLFQTGINPSTGDRFWTTGIDMYPDGSLIAVGSTDGHVYVLDAATGAVLQDFGGHESWIVIRGVAFSPDGNTLASASIDGRVLLWDTLTGTPRPALEHVGLQLLGISWHADGRHLASASDEAGEVMIWDVSSASVSERIAVGQGLITTLDYTDDGQILGIAGVNGHIYLKVPEQGREMRLDGSVAAVPSFAFLDNTRLVAAAAITSADVIAFDLVRRELQPLTGLYGQMHSIAVSPDGTMIAAGNDAGEVSLWDVQTRQQLRVFDDLQGSGIAAVTFSGDGRSLVASNRAESSVPMSTTVAVWDIGSGTLKYELDSAEGPVIGLESQPGTLLLCGIRSDSLLLWDLEDGHEVRRISSGASHIRFTSVAFSIDGGLLAAGANDGTVGFWDAADGGHVFTRPFGSVVLALAFNPDGEELAVGLRDGSVRLLNLGGR